MIMKRIFLSTALLLVSASTLISCRETTQRETVVREVEVERPVRVEVQEREGILERGAKKVDRKVNKEIDKEIDRIGDDN
ncbi:hypothetical protein BH23BAC2_BH23BAC2_04520 [soil metagenome]